MRMSSGSFAQPSALDRYFQQEGVVRLRLSLEKPEDVESLLDSVLGVEEVEDFTLASTEAEVTCQPQNLARLRDNLLKLNVEVISFELRWNPTDLVQLDEEDIEPFAELVDKLEELDDVQAVIHTADMDDEQRNAEEHHPDHSV
jgi:transcriptional/translational regulatory protein YebC/TACO1